LFLPVVLNAQVVPTDLTVAFGGGGSWVDGDVARFQKHTSQRADGYAGVFDFSRRRILTKGYLSVAGRFVAGNADALLNLRWETYGSHYFDVGYRQFRTWYDGSGAWFPGGDTWIQLYDESLAVDRSRLWFEFGVIPLNKPNLVFRYEHRTRSGKKDSLRLGDTRLTGGYGIRYVVPTFLDLDESRDILTVDLTRKATDYVWEAGLRYDRSELDNTRNANRNPDEEADRKVTTRDQTISDLFSAYAYTMRRLNEKLTFSTSGSYMTLNTSLGGYRVYGDDYDAVFDPEYGNLRFKDGGFLDLSSNTRSKQFAANLNLLYQPAAKWRIRVAFRGEDVRREGISFFDQWSVSGGLRTSVTEMAAESRRDLTNLNESVEVRYTGLKNWTFNLRGEWYQGRGDLFEHKNEVEADKVVLDRLTDDRRNHAKYTLTSNWYPVRGLTFSAGAAWWEKQNAYEHLRDSSPPNRIDRYPAYITDQDFGTVDLNVRMSWRVNPKLSLVTRVDYRTSDVTTKMEELSAVRSGEWRSRIFSQNITWNPLSRFYLAATVNLVRDEGEVPGTDVVLKSENDYVLGTLSAGWAVNDRNDLTLETFFYETDNFVDTSELGQPYGAGEKRHHLALSWGFRYTEDLLFTTRYTIASNRDSASGGNNDYDAQSIYLNVQYRF